MKSSNRLSIVPGRISGTALAATVAVLTLGAPALAQQGHGGQPAGQHGHTDDGHGDKAKASSGAPAAAATAKYFCPMHCEGAKTYDKPGECPVCKMKLKKQTSEQFSVEVKPVGGVKIEAGKPVNIMFTLKDPTGLAVKSVEVVHEKPLHLLMVSKDLSWYAHEHPSLQPDGTFTLSSTFPAGGEYTLFHDFTPKDVGMQVVPVTLTVEGAVPPAKPLAADNSKPKTVDGYTVTLDTGGPIKTGAATHMAYTISKDGKPVTDLAPYLGAMGHLVIISQDLKEFVHSHPHEGGEHAAGGHDDKGASAHGHAGDTKGGPKVDFEAHFKAAGLYKGWAQFQHNGKVITVPFTFDVVKGDGGTEAKPHDHSEKDNHGDHGHGEGGSLGTTTIGPWTVSVSGEVKAGSEAHLDIKLSGSTVRPAAVRVWIGTKDGKGAMKQKADTAGGGTEYHAHAEVPKRIPAGAQLWVEIDDGKGTKSVGGFPISK